MLFTLELIRVDEALTDPCLIIDEGQSLRVVWIAEAAKKRWTKVNSLCKGLIIHILEKRIADSYSKKEIWDSFEK